MPFGIAMGISVSTDSVSLRLVQPSGFRLSMTVSLQQGAAHSTPSQADRCSTHQCCDCATHLQIYTYQGAITGAWLALKRAL